MNTKSSLFRVKVKGISMENLFFSGDTVIAQKYHNYKFGDIIVFRRRGSNVIHRIIFNFCGLMIQNGDNEQICSVVRKKDVIGKAVLLYRGDAKISLEDVNSNRCCAKNNILCLVTSCLLDRFHTKYLFKTNAMLQQRKRENQLAIIETEINV
jgi:hypothetical protein